MKKLFALSLVLLLSLALFACKKAPAEDNGRESTVFAEKDEATSQRFLEALTLRKIAPEKIKVVYFDVRAGVRETAEAFCAELGCGSFELVPVVPYPENEDALLAREAEDLADNRYPAMGKYLENASDYLALIVVYPELNGNMPMILKTFLDDYDLRRTAVLPVCVCSGTNAGESFGQIKDFMLASPVYSGLEVHSGDDIPALCKEWADAALK